MALSYSGQYYVTIATFILWSVYLKKAGNIKYVNINFKISIKHVASSHGIVC